MHLVSLKPERRAQVEEFAKRWAKTPATALHQALSAYLEWELQDFAETMERIRRELEGVEGERRGRDKD